MLFLSLTWRRIAEVSGLISQFEAWVVEETLDCAARVFKIELSFAFDVDASIARLMDKDFSVENCLETFKRRSLPLSTVAFEITKKAFVQDADGLHQSVVALSLARDSASASTISAWVCRAYHISRK